MGRKEYKKVYHGVPKSIIDEHTIFYASFDGITSAYNNKYQNITHENDPGIIEYLHSSQGLGVQMRSYNKLIYPIKNSDNEVITIDFTIQPNGDILNKTTTIKNIVTLNNSSKSGIYSISRSNSTNGWAGEFFDGYYYNIYDGTAFETTKTTFVRLIIDQKNRILRFFENGKEIPVHGSARDTKPNLPSMERFKSVSYVTIGSINASGYIISDIHISNIDRGDYFPNLPQDFIDGKAIIKPRMGQQQIKGDPMYSQVTTVKIPAFNAESSKLYCLNADRSKGYLRDNPEIFDVINADKWNSGSSFKIKGLNGEVISGVIDTNTALARVTKSNLDRWNITTITVDDVTKLSKGDTFILYVASNGYYTTEATIQSINTKTNEITLTSKLLASEGGVWGVIDLSTDPDQYIFETTRNTSSPLVKTKDGTTVLGVWKGLETPNATFTLGNNNDGLQGKDLYVEYSLTMPLGNSDFKDKPQDIEYINNRNSVKLKETNKLTIEDDFMGKTKQYGDTCSSTLHYISSSDLVNPLSSLNNSNEIMIGDYSKISLLNTSSINRNSSKQNDILQLVSKFNLIDMVENKFSTELPGNKLEWIKSHISKFSFYVIGKGNTTIYLSPYNVDESKWFGSDSKYSGTNFSPILYVHSSGNKPSEDWVNKSIDSNGNVYFRIYTDAVKASTEFSIDIAYIKLEIELKYDTTFNLYFSENRRAREDKCIPMLVQKETKTIKSYLDIKEPIVTEYAYNKFKGVSPSVVPSFEEFEYSNNIQINSMGTGRAVTANNVNYKASIAYLTKRDTCNYTAEPVCNTAYELYSDYATEHYASGTKYISRTNTYANRSYGILVDGRDVDANNFTTIFPFLINYNGSLHLGTITDFFINRKQSGQEIYYFPLPNTPLLK